MSVAKEVMTMKVGKHFVRAAVPPSTYNSDRRTVEAVISTGARAKRFDHNTGEMFLEELDMSPSSVDLGRCNNGAAPVLTNHDFGGGGLFGGGNSNHTGAVGVVESARVQDQKILAVLRLSRRQEIEGLLQDIEDGIVRQISIGYRVNEYEDRGFDEETGMPIRAAIDYEILEVSLVTVPVDADSQTRGVGDDTFSATVKRKTEGDTSMTVKKREEEENKKTPEVEASGEAKASEEVKTEEKKESSEEGEKPAEEDSEEKPSEEKTEEKPSEEKEEPAEKPVDESERSVKILDLCAKAELPNEFARSLIAEKASIEVAQRKIINEWSQRGAKPVNNIEVTREEKDILARGITEALMHRSNPKDNELTDMGRKYRGMSLVDMARRCLEECGVKTEGMSRMQIAAKALSQETRFRSGYHVTADFPELLANVANKSLRDAYLANRQTFRPFVREATSPDFKQVSRIQLGEGPGFVDLQEGKKVEYSTLAESAEKYNLVSYAVGLILSRQMIINDDLSGFTRVPANFGNSASRLESDIVYKIFLENANMADGNALYSANHNNIASTSVEAPTEASLSELRTLAQKQTGPDGDLIDVMLDHLIVPPELQTASQKQVGQISPNSDSDFNPFVGMFNVISEPRLSSGISRFGLAGDAAAWFMSATPSVVDTIEVLTLEGEEGVRIDQEVDFDSKGVKITALHDFAAKALDWRGLYRNAGQ